VYDVFQRVIRSAQAVAQPAAQICVTRNVPVATLSSCLESQAKPTTRAHVRQSKSPDMIAKNMTVKINVNAIRNTTRYIFIKNVCFDVSQLK